MQSDISLLLLKTNHLLFSHDDCHALGVNPGFPPKRFRVVKYHRSVCWWKFASGQHPCAILTAERLQRNQGQRAETVLATLPSASAPVSYLTCPLQAAVIALTTLSPYSLQTMLTWHTIILTVPSIQEQRILKEAVKTIYDCDIFTFSLQHHVKQHSSSILRLCWKCGSSRIIDG